MFSGQSIKVRMRTFQEPPAGVSRSSDEAGNERGVSSLRSPYPKISPTSEAEISVGGIVARIASGARKHLMNYGFRGLEISVAEQSDKEIDIKLATSIEAILVHALYNAADHGFILPDASGDVLRRLRKLDNGWEVLSAISR